MDDDQKQDGEESEEKEEESEEESASEQIRDTDFNKKSLDAIVP